jgi:hypothetical protein
MQPAHPLHIAGEANPARPFTVIGPRGALLGKQNGTFEAWIFPWKILSDMRITAETQNYGVPIDVNSCASSIDVSPNVTAITYSHANFTIRQIMFAPKSGPEGTGALVLYEIKAFRPTTLTFSFTPEMHRMWPAPSDPFPDTELVVQGRPGSGEKRSGFYILRESLPGYGAAIAMPNAEPGIPAPYQERPHTWPLQFVLHYDPAKDSNTLFPLLIDLAVTPQSGMRDAMANSLTGLNSTVPSLYKSNAEYYAKLLSTHTSIVTPDEKLNAAFSWAVAAIDELRVETPEHNGQAYTAGFANSGDSVRPGFGWFFGRDALWTLYAVNSYGAFDAAREEIEFLLRHQRADGKILHEYAQTSNQVDWQSLPYEYAAADSTPLLLMATDDYLKVSGDIKFMQAHWTQLEQAWNFETSHDSEDGIYNNTQGTGWVESWVPSMPHQEIYLAALDAQASVAFAHLARAAGHNDEASKAATRAAQIGQAIEKEYYLPGEDLYAFSLNADGTTDNTQTILSSVAWWDGTFRLAHSSTTMQRWSSSEFSTDWGTRILGDSVRFYDPISYHQGSVWPLFTGWVAMADYRNARPLEGFSHMMQNANLTWMEDPGTVTELLSGNFFKALSRSTPHQLWSSAMVISPILRGMFGLSWSASTGTLEVNPQLPANWGSASLHHVPFGDSSLDLNFERQGGQLIVKATGATGVRLTSSVPNAVTAGNTLRIPLPPIEIAISQSLPGLGAETTQMKVLDEKRSARSLALTLAAQGGTEETLYLRENSPGLQLHCEQARIGDERNGLRTATVTFPPGSGYVKQNLIFSW